MIRVPGVPSWLNRFLFEHSTFYQRSAVVWSRRPGLPEREAVQEFAERRLVHVDDLVRSSGGKLLLFLAPGLDRPFAVTDASPPDWQLALLEFARRRGIPAFTLQRELIDEDHNAVRMDPCCHFNAAGHRVLAGVMERVVVEQLPVGLPPSFSGGTGTAGHARDPRRARVESTG